MTAQRRFAVALVLSIAMHALFLGTTRPLVRPGAPARDPTPLTVRIVEAFRDAPAVVVPETAPPLPQPVPQVRPRIAVPQAAERRPTPRVETVPAREPASAQRTAPTRFDMAALIEQRRAQRQAAEHAAAYERQEANAATDPGASAIQRNLVMSGDDGVGGIFEILYKGTSTAQYAFNGWRPDTHRQWREVIEVNAPAGGDIERAIVRSMITLIRTHYEGDFRWESRRLGRVVALSARIEDNGFLEEFLMREFFGTPLVKQARPR
jgi:hypothetical protein